MIDRTVMDGRVSILVVHGGIAPVALRSEAGDGHTSSIFYGKKARGIIESDSLRFYVESPTRGMNSNLVSVAVGAWLNLNGGIDNPSRFSNRDVYAWVCTPRVALTHPRWSINGAPTPLIKDTINKLGRAYLISLVCGGINVDVIELPAVKVWRPYSLCDIRLML